MGHDDLDRRPIPPPIDLVLVGARVVTLPLGLELFHLGGAFWAGGTSFRRLKAIGDLQERLRGATILVRRHLGADHFEGRGRVSGVETAVVEGTQVYAGRLPELSDDVFYIPGVGDDPRAPAPRPRAIRVARRPAIR